MYLTLCRKKLRFFVTFADAVRSASNIYLTYNAKVTQCLYSNTYRMCISPVTIKNSNKNVMIKGQTEYIQVPCRCCSECRKDKFHDILNNIFSLYAYQKTLSPYFVTLTYNEENVPKNSLGINILCYRDVQSCLKRFRRLGYFLKYFVCGEYGSRFNRPHYHLILFVDNPDINKVKEDFNKTWNKGFISFEKIKHAGSITYVSKYITKPYQYNFKAIGINHEPKDIIEQRQMMRELSIPPQFVKRSVRLIDLLLNSKQALYKKNLFNYFKLRYNGKIQKCYESYSFDSEISSQSILQEIGLSFEELLTFQKKLQRFDIRTNYTYLSKNTRTLLYKDNGLLGKLNFIIYLIRFLNSKSNHSPYILYASQLDSKIKNSLKNDKLHHRFILEHEKVELSEIPY